MELFSFRVFSQFILELSKTSIYQYFLNNKVLPDHKVLRSSPPKAIVTGVVASSVGGSSDTGSSSTAVASGSGYGSGYHSAVVPYASGSGYESTALAVANAVDGANAAGVAHAKK
jgi:hypothetical protein